MHMNNIAPVLYKFYVGAYSGNTRLFLPVLYLCTCFHRIRPHTKAEQLPPGNFCSQVQKSAACNVVQLEQATPEAIQTDRRRMQIIMAGCGRWLLIFFFLRLTTMVLGQCKCGFLMWQGGEEISSRPYPVPSCKRIAGRGRGTNFSWHGQALVHTCLRVIVSARILFRLSTYWSFSINARQRHYMVYQSGQIIYSFNARVCIDMVEYHKMLQYFSVIKNIKSLMLQELVHYTTQLHVRVTCYILAGLCHLFSLIACSMQIWRALGDLIGCVISSRPRVDTWGRCPTNYSNPFCLPDGMHLHVCILQVWSLRPGNVAKFMLADKIGSL